MSIETTQKAAGFTLAVAPDLTRFAIDEERLNALLAGQRPLMLPCMGDDNPGYLLMEFAKAALASGALTHDPRLELTVEGHDGETAGQWRLSVDNAVPGYGNTLWGRHRNVDEFELDADPDDEPGRYARVILEAIVEEANGLIAPAATRQVDDGAPRAETAPARIEVVVVRDPDGGTILHLFVDGEPTPFEQYNVDPGGGFYTRQEWDRARDKAVTQASPACAQALIAAYDDPPGEERLAD